MPLAGRLEEADRPPQPSRQNSRRERGARRLRAGTLILGVLAVARLWLAVLPADAQVTTPTDSRTLAAARTLGQQGVALYQQGDFARALDKLERAYAVVKVPTLALWSARALRQLGRLVEAAQRYREVGLFSVGPSDPEVFRSSQAEARRELEALDARLPRVTIALIGGVQGDTLVSIDRRPLPDALVDAPVPLNPGTHTIEARRGGWVASQEVTLADAERRRVELRLQPEARAEPVAPVAETAVAKESAAASPPPLPPIDSGREEQSASMLPPWLLVGTGGAFVVAGGVLGALALSAKSNVEDAEDGSDWAVVRSDNNHVPTYSTLGFAFAGAGAALVVAGLVWRSQLSSGGERGVRVRAGVGRIVLRGAF